MAYSENEDGEVKSRGIYSDSDDDAPGGKRKHKKKDKDERASKRHKDKKKKHKRDKGSDSDEASKDPSPMMKPRDSGRSRSPRGRSRSGDRRRASPRGRSRSPPRRREDRGRSPPRRGYDRRDDRGGGRRDDRGYDRRGGGGGYRRDDRDRRDRRDDIEIRAEKERKEDEARKEKERDAAEAARKKKEEEEYAKKMQEQFAAMQEDEMIGSDGEIEFEDEEAKAERERRERKERMERIKAEAAAKKAAEPKADSPPPVKNLVSPRTQAAAPPTEPEPMSDLDEETENVDMLAAITPRAKGLGGEDTDEEDEEKAAGDVDELNDEEDRKDRKKSAEEDVKGKEFNMFDEGDEIAGTKEVIKAIDRGENKLDTANFDDKEGYLTFQLGEVFNSRYQIKKTLGKGVFSTVLQAVDTKFPAELTKDKKEVKVAIKIIRNNDMMAKASQKELEVLQLLTKDGGAEKHHIVQLLDNFQHHGHMCLVFETMAMNLREVIKKFGHNRGINIEGVQVFSKQMFSSLKHLRKCKIVHADIKPDNILINERHNAIKICDLGSCSYINECDITPYLVSRWYRAPEITLCLKYDYGIDLWSIGCCLYELYTGKVMFPGNSNNDMLRRFMEIRGRFPNKLIKRSMTKMIELGRPVDFTEDFKFMRIMVDKITKKETVKVITIDEKPVKDLLKLLMPTTLQPDQARKVKQLSELLHGALALNPDNRMSIEQCLAHPFVKEPFGFQPKRKEQPKPPGA